MNKLVLFTKHSDDTSEALNDNDMRNLGIIASAFMYLLLAFEISDLLYLSLKNRVDFSRKAYIDEYKNHLDNSID